MTYHFRLQRSGPLAHRSADLPERRALLEARRHDSRSRARRAWRNERGSIAGGATVHGRLLPIRPEVCRLPAFAAEPVRGCPAVMEDLPPWPISIFGTALGTTLLAGATGWLAWSTRSEVRATQQLAELTRRQQAASDRPVAERQPRSAHDRHGGQRGWHSAPSSTSTRPGATPWPQSPTTPSRRGA